MPHSVDPFDLQRFLDAQARNYADAIDELRAGEKRSHWMWYVFPQYAGLGSSPMARRFAIGSLDEAKAYLRHHILGPRLVECANAVLAVQGVTAHDIFGSPDDMKLHSSATLFSRIAEPGSVFHRILDRYFDGEADKRTLDLLSGGEHGST
ncbi:MAG TPA: DUF1810 domain-containing protein [Gemmatimonadaceae bacterium]|nr:DUF1810 domain-containing protein [Gemmatimonadaceae bacterium]